MKTVATLLLILGLTPRALTQEFSIGQNPDTLTLRSMVFPRTENSFWQTSPFRPINSADSAAMANLPPGFLRSEMLADPMNYQDHFDLTASLKLQWQKEDRLDLLRSALGYIQAGGEAYLLYEAMKKHHYIR